MQDGNSTIANWRTIPELLAEGRAGMLRGNYDQARQLFHQALQRSPNHPEARHGLLESLKAQHSWLYRTPLTGVFRWLSRIPWHWVTFVGITLPLLCVKMIRSVPASGIFLWPIVGVIYGAVIFIRIADESATIRVWFSHYRRIAVTVWDVGAAFAGSCCMLGTIGAVVAYFVSGNVGAIMAAIVFFILVGPVDVTFKASPLVPRIVMLGALIVISCLAVDVSIMAFEITGSDLSSRLPPSLGWLFLGLIAGVVLFSPLEKAVRGLARPPDSCFDRASYATQPGGISLSHNKMRQFHPEIYGFLGLFHHWRYPGRGVAAATARKLIDEHLLKGDCQPALVVSIQPLIVAAYTEDLDCAVFLKFDDKLSSDYQLTKGSKLVSINTYMVDGQGGQDLQPGPNRLSPWKNIWPCIADFLSDDVEAIAQRKREISPDSWRKATIAVEKAILRRNQPIRRGEPLLSLAAV